MNNTVAAQYFDGQSSASQSTTVVLNNITKEFRLQFANGTFCVWLLVDIEFEQYGSVLEIRNRNYSGAILKIDDPAFAKQFYVVMKQNKRIDIHTRLLHLGFTNIMFIALGLFALIVLAYFYVLPPVAEKSAALLPESFDNEIGDVFMDTFLDENEVDTTKTQYLEQFAAKLHLQNHKPLHFTVVTSDEVNAFALPNGHIVVYSGILENMESPEALVALLGHEAAHVNNRHSTKMLCRNLAGYMVVSLLFTDVNGIMAVLANNAQQLHSLSYSRAFEQEADEQGLEILMLNNLNPNGMVKLFEQLEQESKISVPEIMSSHPLTKERKKNMQRIISETAYQVQSNDTLKAIFENMKRTGILSF